jgi:hypothetical protein
LPLCVPIVTLSVFGRCEGGALDMVRGGVRLPAAARAIKRAERLRGGRGRRRRLASIASSSDAGSGRC